MIAVREESDSDHAIVSEIQDAAFGEPGEARLVEALRASAFPRISLVAELDGELVGHIFLSPVTIEGKPPGSSCAGLAPVGVMPAVQGRGVGSALIREALGRCPGVGWSVVFLLGDPAYYSRFGFVLAAARGFRYESEVFDSAFQVLELADGTLDGASGWVRYNRAFSDL